jgi:hypothetical protein
VTLESGILYRPRFIIKPMPTYHQLLDNTPLRFWLAGVLGGFLFVSALFGRFYKQGSYKSDTAGAQWEKVAYICLSGGMCFWGFWHIFGL